MAPEKRCPPRATARPWSGRACAGTAGWRSGPPAVDGARGSPAEGEGHLSSRAALTSAECVCACAP
eukprot:9482160-Pyramimonas_sp.AAC.1